MQRNNHSATERAWNGSSDRCERDPGLRDGWAAAPRSMQIRSAADNDKLNTYVLAEGSSNLLQPKPKFHGLLTRGERFAK